MTIEEKAKAYDEALEQAKFYHGNCPSEPERKKLEKMFPELRESEDERIIEEIKFAVMQMPTERQDTKERCIAWLEKQKDHFRDDTKKVEKQDYSGLNDLERVIHRGFLSAGVENVPVGIIKETAQECLAEMKPAEWSEDDEKIYQHCLIILHDYGYDEWFKSLRPQPKQEWNEEDEYLLGETIQHLEELIRIDKAKHCGVDVQYYQRDIDWLKSLPERFNLQPKQEWSEEDEKHINIIFCILDRQQCWDGATGKKFNPYQDEIDWLKSLRPQHHWKPSEEEMKALDVACSGKLWYGHIYLEGLKRIREQLKKLM